MTSVPIPPRPPTPPTVTRAPDWDPQLAAIEAALDRAARAGDAMDAALGEITAAQNALGAHQAADAAELDRARRGEHHPPMMRSEPPDGDIDVGTQLGLRNARAGELANLRNRLATAAASYVPAQDAFERALTAVRTARTAADTWLDAHPLPPADAEHVAAVLIHLDARTDALHEHCAVTAGASAARDRELLRETERLAAGWRAHETEQTGQRKSRMRRWYRRVAMLAAGIGGTIAILLLT